MTTLREARVKAAREALELSIGFGTSSDPPVVSFDRVAEAVVDALFTPDPHLDNMQVPVKVQIEG